MKKRRMVMKVQINCDKCRRKAMDVAAKHGADSVAVEGEQNDLLVVRGGDGVDPAELAIELRKKLGHAKIVSVDEIRVVEPEENGGGIRKGEAPAPAPPPRRDPDCCCCCSNYLSRPPPPVVIVHGDYDAPQPCSIM